MSYLSSKELIGKKNRKYGEVDLPTLGGKLRVAQLSAADNIELSELNELRQRGEAVHAKLTKLIVGKGVVDENGKQMFTNENDLEQFLRDVSGETVNEIVEAISALSQKKKAEGSSSGN